MTEEKESPVKSYFQERMDLLGVTPEDNQIQLLQYDPETRENILVPTPVFTEVDEGIEILVYTLDRLKIQFAKEGSRWKRNYFSIIRLEKPAIDKNGNENKYRLPRNQGTQPFFHPRLIEKYEKKEEIKTLFLTEGYFKAWKGCAHGLDVVGVSSITHLTDNKEKTLYPDILKLIIACKVSNVVWLTDGDCLSISQKDVTEVKDLYRRPHRFFASATKFQRLLETKVNDTPLDVHKYFMHVDSENIENGPKGLDDLLIEYHGKEKEVVDDLNDLGREPRYFKRIDISYGTGKLHRYFRLHNINDFFLYHSEKRPELKISEFTFNGTRYKWNEDKETCDIVVPADAKNYFRVGDQYHEFIKIPNKYGKLEPTFARRQKSTIFDDHGKSIFQFIPKYKGFCVVPDHVNFQPAINNCFNLYAPFEHEPEEETDCPVTLKFIEHIFGTRKVRGSFKGKQLEITETDMGLDYLQLLYQKPTQTLPILCLVSEERQTGKTTFIKYLKKLFTQNVAIVGNEDLSNAFNAHWASKLIIACDETKIDKQVVVEKVKSLSTADKVSMNAKGKDQIELDFFGKFIFASNNEDNFIYTDEKEVRFWVRKVPTIPVDSFDVDLLSALDEEIPSFLNFLNKRKMATENMHRAWFHPSLLKTEALKKVIQNTMPTIVKELRHQLREMFLDFGVTEIRMTNKVILTELLKGRYETNYLHRVIKNELQATQFHFLVYGEEDGTEKKKYLTIDEIKEDYPGGIDETLIRKHFQAIRYSYPKWEKHTDINGEEVFSQFDVTDHGRPYVFLAENFLSEDEISGLSKRTQKSTDLPF